VGASYVGPHACNDIRRLIKISLASTRAVSRTLPIFPLLMSGGRDADAKAATEGDNWKPARS
jgi:hypothetical protein